MITKSGLDAQQCVVEELRLELGPALILLPYLVDRTVQEGMLKLETAIHIHVEVILRIAILLTKWLTNEFDPLLGLDHQFLEFIVFNFQLGVQFGSWSLSLHNSYACNNSSKCLNRHWPSKIIWIFDLFSY